MPACHCEDLSKLPATIAAMEIPKTFDRAGEG
jgi:hypothetical protein